ncbi:hypothetical protein L249_8055 [Ophiocordyceps polyrhachis-furcata BCC 54312]|uniref:GH16 domain-containing protein n=1 Tax=Ophiocordyceps polyrhachis-furcata BCC 54312 TaxID=1330021 RepID=A0A367LII1_9HYPO|nr:hypothetical protein L249_8055 [Ophiocordyceps polyrhachis-furcata BCC 54312]
MDGHLNSDLHLTSNSLAIRSLWLVPVPRSTKLKSFLKERRLWMKRWALYNGYNRNLLPCRPPFLRSSSRYKRSWKDMAYALTSSFAGQSLLNGFDWFDGVDPSHGSVAYQSRANAEAKGLFSVDENTGVVRLKVDHQHRYGPHEGRPSIRLESKETYNHGLFISDFLHMPPSQCGLWPAFWAYGSQWPKGGEVDIIEGVNTLHRNAVTAHTAEGCILESSPDSPYSGTMSGTRCAVGNQNIGCGFSSPPNVTTSYGDGFNAANGGVYAMLWDSSHIKVWHFPRSEIPGDIEAKRPDPQLWKPPVAVFGGSKCAVDSFFKNMKLVININFCGDWGNAVWGKTDQCNAFAPTCSEYVASSPEAFANAYWDVRYIDTYRVTDGRDTSAPPSHSYITTATSSSAATSSIAVTVPEAVISSTVVTSPTTTTTTTMSMPLMSLDELPKLAAAVNPSRIGRYAYLGCFGSLNGFKTFGKVVESSDMTLEMCVDLCDGRKFAATVDANCLCADSLDAETRAATPQEAAVCDDRCPGNEDEFCGGHRQAVVVGGGGGAGGAGDRGGGGAGRGLRFASMPFTNSSSRILVSNQRRGLSGSDLVSLYAAVAVPVSPPLPPPFKGSGMSEVLPISNTAYRTVHPLTNPGSALVNAEMTRLPMKPETTAEEGKLAAADAAGRGRGGPGRMWPLPAGSEDVRLGTEEAMMADPVPEPRPQDAPGGLPFSPSREAESVSFETADLWRDSRRLSDAEELPDRDDSRLLEEYSRLPDAARPPQGSSLWDDSRLSGISDLSENSRLSEAAQLPDDSRLLRAPKLLQGSSLSKEPGIAHMPEEDSVRANYRESESGEYPPCAAARTTGPAPSPSPVHIADQRIGHATYGMSTQAEPTKVYSIQLVATAARARACPVLILGATLFVAALMW